MTAAPSHLYYRSMQGSWRCDFDFAITDWRAFWRSPMRVADRVQILGLLTLQCIPGTMVFETSVDYAATCEHGQVLHTSRLRKWGVTLFESIEVMTLHDDGRHATMRGDRPNGDVEVDANATAASYSFDWFGSPMTQRTQVEPPGLRVDQVTSWSRGVQLLRRV